MSYLNNYENVNYCEFRNEKDEKQNRQVFRAQKKKGTSTVEVEYFNKIIVNSIFFVNICKLIDFKPKQL